MASTKQMQERAKARKQEQRPHSTKEDGNWADLLCVLKNDKTGLSEFQRAQVCIPAHSSASREQLLEAICSKPWGHSTKIVGLVAHYLSYSPSLTMVRSGFNAPTFNVRTGRTENINLNDLGVVIEFQTNGKEFSTNGPSWCSKHEVDERAANLLEAHRDLDVRRYQ